MTTRDSFMDRDFSRIDPLACLLDLSASVSKNPAELAPVRPVLEFDMVDPRLVEEADVLSGLDQRPNPMALKPGEFESLTTNLFTKIGLETRQTQASRDGGVDCVAFDNRPIFGRKVIIHRPSATRTPIEPPERWEESPAGSGPAHWDEPPGP